MILATRVKERGRLPRAACLVLLLLLAASPAHAGLKIRPVFKESPPPAAGKMVGGGNLEIQIEPRGPHFETIYAPDDAGPLMVGNPVAGKRQLISGLDVLLIAQLSSFDKPNLNATLSPPW
jgi:hypothetical protein